MRRTRAIFIAIVAIAVSTGFTTDNAKEAAADFAKVRDAYAKSSDLSMSIVYNLYSDHSSSVVVDQHNGYYCKQGKENVYMELYGTMTVRNKDLFMVKDDSSKIILLKRSPSVKQENQALAVDIEKLLAVCSSVKSMPAGENAAGYKLTFPGQSSDIRSVEVYFDKRSYFVQKMIIYYNREMDYDPADGKKELHKPRLEVQYKEIVTKPVVSGSQFSVARYLKKVNKKWQLQQAFAGYQLIDQTNTEL